MTMNCKGETMFIECVQYSFEPHPVNQLIHNDGIAEYRLVKNIATRIDNENNKIIEGQEVYFEIPSNQPKPSVDEIQADFNHWWEYGVQWHKEVIEKSFEERFNEINIKLDSLINGIKAGING